MDPGCFSSALNSPHTEQERRQQLAQDRRRAGDQGRRDRDSRRENDLVLGTFGRGIYIVDDYSPLRLTSAQTLASPAICTRRDALLFVPTQHYGGRGKAFQGEMLYAGDIRRTAQ